MTYMGGRVRALAGVTLAIAPGEVFGIIGPNGAGPGRRIRATVPERDNI